MDYFHTGYWSTNEWFPIETDSAVYILLHGLLERGSHTGGGGVWRTVWCVKASAACSHNIYMNVYVQILCSSFMCTHPYWWYCYCRGHHCCCFVHGSIIVCVGFFISAWKAYICHKYLRFLPYRSVSVPVYFFKFFSHGCRHESRLPILHYK